METVGWRRRLVLPLRLTQAAVLFLLAAAAVALSWLGGTIVAVELTSSYKDSAYLPLALVPLGAAAIAATATWLLLVMLCSPLSRRTRRAFGATVLLLPCVAAVTLSVLAALWRGLSPGELARNALPVLVTIGLTAGVAWLVHAAARA